MFSFIIFFILAILAYDSLSTQRLASSPIVLEEINNSKDPSPIYHRCSECGRLYTSNVNEDVKTMNNSNSQNVLPVNDQGVQPQQPSNYSGSIFEEVKLEEYSPNPSMVNRNYSGLTQEQIAVLEGVPQFSDRWAFYPEEKAIVIPENPDIVRPLVNENTDNKNLNDKENKSSSDKKSTNGNKNDKKSVSKNKKSSKNSSLDLMNSSILILIGLMIGISLIN